MPSIPQIFSSLRDTPRWTLHRTLKSANPQDIQGSLRGTASFTPLSLTNTNTNTNTSKKNDNINKNQDILYSEEGSVPTGPLAGLRFSKKYIWRFTSTLAPNGSSTSVEPTEGVSVWFVKPSSTSTPPGATDTDTDTQNEKVEADYLFHEFEVLDAKALSSAILDDDTFVTPPVPPADDQNTDNTTTTVVARGNHLCINDMYRTAYAFRVGRDSGDVVSWASRHVVRGPKKDQDIVNYYTREMA
ncbi:hypothetical protein BDW42DRAFT_33840 [Aspergillus taichungensis]|uniref:DUF6314 domain-containing protein n=1 Tax=Aspergillus taichungensis TaxID=482145 RepID=A0A2J5HFE9_9EURO|nr:hypothetical protein BDW42DRAFT_33840 [Aspergillus taichungensis]